MSTGQPVTHQEVLKHAHQIHEKIRRWRRTIHAMPELSFTEHHTASLVNTTLLDLGIETETEVAKTGVIGRIQGSAGPLVGLRADMDALPISEENETSFNSSQPGIMHACGHDAHTAMLMGAATILKDLADRNRLPGSVRLLFQPSEEAQDEEGKSGGMRMVEEGALDGVDAVFGIHVNTKLPTGHLGTRHGPILAATDRFEAIIRGAGGHAARPDLTLDPIALSAHVINAIHQIISRRLDPLDSGVITIGAIEGGQAFNVIPDTVTLRGTIRSYSPEARTLLEEQFYRACRVVEPLGGRVEIEFLRGYPTTVNAPETTDVVFRALNELVGEEQVHEVPPVMAGEDFSFMAQQVPGCFMNLGVRNPEWDREYPVHTSTFRLDEDALPIGTAALVTAALQWMDEQKN
ncbi:amidohydrolase [Chloroflexi bacterium TSY]|nr:amidohydrolase [Chloroflexi bacterium TSY]